MKFKTVEEVLEAPYKEQYTEFIKTFEPRAIYFAGANKESKVRVLANSYPRKYQGKAVNVVELVFPTMEHLRAFETMTNERDHLGGGKSVDTNPYITAPNLMLSLALGGWGGLNGDTIQPKKIVSKEYVFHVPMRKALYMYTYFSKLPGYPENKKLSEQQMIDLFDYYIERCNRMEKDGIITERSRKACTCDNL